MTNHVNEKSPQGLENHDSIVSSYKELIREQVNIPELFLISKQFRDTLESSRTSITSLFFVFSPINVYFLIKEMCHEHSYPL